MSTPIPTDDEDVDRRRAALYIAPFLVLGVGNLLLILMWGVNPLWGFAILPPILFISVIGWIAFKGGFAHDRGGAPDDRVGE
ncbi:hypothetical protein G9464_08900 [Halostella sp. JP-L12]|uniref:hypothetical protein n=1 Tax=Halostella TaxID=1843185 RepID=UPI000EF7AFC8|nr:MULTISPECIES: hypothetical protein [Halostella]NHN47714.1 hypothetical protein [Halostella sp. JP-L12]